MGDAAPVQIRFVATFGDVPEGQPLLYVNSRGKLSLALNMANFMETHGVTRGITVRVLH